MAVPRSKLMDMLYGEAISIDVYNRIHNLDEVLNEEVQLIAYERYWARPGLSIRDKSLITVATLIAMGKEQQTRPHMSGFLNTGGTADILVNMLIHLSPTVGTAIAEKGFDALIDVLNDLKIDAVLIKELKNTFAQGITKTTNNINLQARDLGIINIAASVAIGKQEQTITNISKCLSEPGCSETDLRNLLIHQIIYCGFPSVINGFGALKSALEIINQ